MASKPPPLVEARSLYKHYLDGGVDAVKNISLTLESGRIYALKGRSGCGKSTLLHLIGLLDAPDSGELAYAGQTLTHTTVSSRFRREFFGFVFQFHHLLPVLTLRENIEAALIHNADMSAGEQRERTEALLRELALEQRIDARTNRVSGGERQRAAIARALVNQPTLVLADEPTGNVDSANARKILDYFQAYVKNHHATLLIATHDDQVSAVADTVLSMEDGELVSITQRTRHEA
jgi:putative ABC transport system ATP-binding protein